MAALSSFGVYVKAVTISDWNGFQNIRRSGKTPYFKHNIASLTSKDFLIDCYGFLDLLNVSKFWVFVNPTGETRFWRCMYGYKWSNHKTASMEISVEYVRKRTALAIAKWRSVMSYGYHFCTFNVMKYHLHAFIELLMQNCRLGSLCLLPWWLQCGSNRECTQYQIETGWSFLPRGRSFHSR